MQVKQTDSNKLTKGSACFKLSLLRPSNPEDFPLGKSLTIFETSFNMINLYIFPYYDIGNLLNL